MWHPNGPDAQLILRHPTRIIDIGLPRTMLSSIYRATWMQDPCMYFVYHCKFLAAVYMASAPSSHIGLLPTLCKFPFRSAYSGILLILVVPTQARLGTRLLTAGSIYTIYIENVNAQSVCRAAKGSGKNTSRSRRNRDASRLRSDGSLC